MLKENGEYDAGRFREALEGVGIRIFLREICYCYFISVFSVSNTVYSSQEAMRQSKALLS